MGWRRNEDGLQEGAVGWGGRQEGAPGKENGVFGRGLKRKAISVVREHQDKQSSRKASS